MNNDDYKVLKTPEEMKNGEKIDLLLDRPIYKNEGKNVHSLLYNIIGFIGFLFFWHF